MKWKVWLGVLGSAIALSACDDDNRPGSDSTTGLASSTTDDVMTTIPVTSVTETSTDPTTVGSSSGSGSGTDTDTDTDATDTDDSTTGSTTDDSTTSTGPGESSSSSTTDDPTTGEPMEWVVEWCNLQFPATIAATTADTTTVYSRIYVEGLTDQTVGNDIDPNLDVEFGYGADGSDPGDDWTWVAGMGNVGWNGMDVGEPNNDEYQGDLQFAAAGTYDYAARVSGDGGTTWVYCDLDGLVEGGYTPDQAGDAIIE